jgi:hypothetical protein
MEKAFSKEFEKEFDEDKIKFFKQVEDCQSYNEFRLITNKHFDKKVGKYNPINIPFYIIYKMLYIALKVERLTEDETV